MKLKVGSFYRAKHPRGNKKIGYNDREIIWMDETTFQYDDGPAIMRWLWRRCLVTHDKFLAWASNEINNS